MTLFGIFHFIFAIVNIEQGVTIALSFAVYKYAVGINFGEYHFLGFKQDIE